MAQFGPSIQTATISTGNFQTTIDAYNASSFAAYPEPYGARNPLGASYYDNPGSNSNPYGTYTKYRYVRYNSTANPALTAVTGPFIVYWTDATFTTVSPVSTESLTGGLNLIAGLAMPNVTALTTLTASGLNGNYCWIAVGGYVSGVYIAAAAVTAGLVLSGSATNFTPGIVPAAGTVPFAVATTAAASNLCNVKLLLES